MKLSLRKDGRWQYNKRINGICKTFYSSEHDERRAQRDIEKQLLNFNTNDHKRKHNFLELAKQVIDEKELSVQWTTVHMYENAMNRLSSDFDTDIEQIKPIVIQNFLNSMAQKQYSYSAIHKNKVFIGLVYDFAIRQGLQIINPIRAIKLPPNIPKNKIHSPDNLVIDKIKANAEGVYFGLWALSLLCTGARRGEQAAFQRNDIDFEKRTIRIWRSVEFVGNQPRLKEIPKTLNSIRNVPILDLLYEPLYNHCQGMKPTDFIFGGTKPLSLTQIRKGWAKYQREIGCKVNQHQLRHAYAELLFKSGIDAKTAQHLLGHSSIQITNDIYTDFDNKLVTPAAEKINDYLNL